MFGAWGPCAQRLMTLAESCRKWAGQTWFSWDRHLEDLWCVQGVRALDTKADGSCRVLQKEGRPEVISWDGYLGDLWCVQGVACKCCVLKDL